MKTSDKLIVFFALISATSAFSKPQPAPTKDAPRISYTVSEQTKEAFNKNLDLSKQYLLIKNNGEIHDAAWFSMEQVFTSMVVEAPEIKYFVHANNQNATIISEKPFHKNLNTNYGLAIRAFFNVRDYETTEWDREGAHHDDIDTHYIIPLSSSVLTKSYYPKNPELFTQEISPQARLDQYVQDECTVIRRFESQQEDALKIFKTNTGFHPARKIIKGASELMVPGCDKEAEWCGDKFAPQLVYYENPIMFFDLNNQPANSKINILYYAGDGTTEIYKDSVFNKDNWVATWVGDGHMDDLDDVMGVMNIPMSVIAKAKKMGLNRFIYRMKNARECHADMDAVNRSWLDFAILFEIVDTRPTVKK